MPIPKLWVFANTEYHSLTYTGFGVQKIILKKPSAMSVLKIYHSCLLFIS